MQKISRNPESKNPVNPSSDNFYPICQKPARFSHFCLKTCTFRQVVRRKIRLIIELVFYSTRLLKALWIGIRSREP
jgi:hypothetical protein